MKILVVGQTAASAAFALLLAPAAAWCAGEPARITLEDCRYGDLEAYGWVIGLAEPDTCWSAIHAPTSTDDIGSIVSMSDPPPPLGSRWRSQYVRMLCTAGGHFSDQEFGECDTYFRSCARRPHKDGPHAVSVEFSLDLSWTPEPEPAPAPKKKKRKKRKKLRRWSGDEFPFSVGLWSKFHPADRPGAPDAAPEDHYTLRHTVVHYPKITIDLSYYAYDAKIKGVQAVELIRKIHRADQFGWSDDGTGQSSYLITIDEPLREQIGILMRRCGIDPLPAP